MRSCYCQTINKRVFWHPEKPTIITGHNNNYTHDEHGHTIDSWTKANI